MILSYPVRVLCLALAAGFLLHAVLMLLLRVAAPWLRRHAERMAPAGAARWVFTWRLAPLAVTALAVGGIGLPVYLRFEPFGLAERVNPGFLAAGALGAFLCALALARWGRAAWALRRLAGECRRGGSPLAAGADNGLGAEASAGAWAVRSAAPFVVLAGLRRPRVVISTAALQRLTPAQLDMALRHEQAHRSAGDSWRRWLFLVLPDALPGVHWRGPERLWTRYSEWAADQTAVAGQPWRAVHLAEALVAVGRGTSPQAPLGAMVTGLANDGAELADRVDRLLAGQAVSAAPHCPLPRWIWPAAGALLTAAAVYVLPHATALYPLLERLVR